MSAVNFILKEKGGDGIRKLATVSATFSASVFISHYLVPPNFYLYLSVFCAITPIFALFLSGETKKKVILISISAAIGFAVSFISYNFKTIPAREVSNQQQKIEARVLDYAEDYPTYSKVYIKLIDDNAPKLNAILYCYGSGIPDLSPGDIIRARVKMKAADEQYGQPFSRLNAENVYLVCYLKGEIEVKGRSQFSFLYFPQNISKEVKESARLVFSENTAPLMVALLTGDKNLLYNDSVLYSKMSEAGILHIVAVSGMHVAFLVGFIRLIFRRKKLASIIGIPLVIFFVPFAGATPSVCRAALMQIMILIAPLLKRENDSITSLTFILAIILLVNPNACASVSLQLSFSATLGIVIITPQIYNSLIRHFKNKRKIKNNNAYKRVLKFAIVGIAASFSATVGALAFSMPIAAKYFGYVSVVGLFVNILIFWAVSVCFVFGYISCFLGMLWLPFGILVGTISDVFARFIITVVHIASSIPYAAIYTKGNFFGYWLYLAYAVFFICFLFRRGKEFRPIIPTCLAVSSLCCIIILTEVYVLKDGGRITALDVGQGQSIIITSGKATAVIDCGGKGKSSNAGDTVAAFLLGNGRRTVDILALTHFDEDHVNGAVRLMSRVDVKRLLIPDGSFGKPIREEILKMAEKQGVEVYIIQDDVTVTSDDLTISAYSVISQGESALMFLGCIGDFQVFISGDANINEEIDFIKNYDLSNTDLFLAGHHGSNYSSSSELLHALNAEYAIISCGYNNYGHPAAEAVERMERAGMEIYRTDILGNVSFKVKGEKVSLG